MGLLTLCFGLLLPWLAGVLWLDFTESLLGRKTPPNRFRQIGYGFFIGYAVLFLALIAGNTMTGTVSWLGLMVFMLVLNASGGAAIWFNRNKNVIDNPHQQPSLTTPVKSLTALVSVLMVIHIVFMAVEIFTQPVYPWDAWLVWVYRAKAWFLAGGMVDIVGSKYWLAATTAEPYTMAAWSYPLFPSVIPYWAALSLGHWSETLINLPVLFAGLAIGSALYGQCREYGLSVPISITACYLLYSIPIVGTHIELAGYADIWMTGFVGLGFISIIVGLIKHANAGRLNFQIVLGFLMIGFGVLVKNEGQAWFLAMLVMLALISFKPRILILTLIAVGVIAVLAVALGFTHIYIPLIGSLGVVNGQFVIPLFGGFVLEPHSIWQAYWTNFITMGNWNLLWVLVAVSLFLSFKPFNRPADTWHESRLRRVGLGFILIFLATQLFIFGFTNQGRWAESYTAINRLPLHFAPALLFTALIMVLAFVKKKDAEISAPGVHNGSA